MSYVLSTKLEDGPGKEGLRREIGLIGAVAYGVGIIIGAGVYALIGVAAGRAGNATWISFGLAALVASFTGLSYARLSALFPSSEAEFVYTHKAFDNRFLAFLVGWLVILTGVMSISTVALGFGGYFRPYVGFPVVVIAAMLLVLVLFINLLGIRESIRANIILTAIEVLGIVIVIVLGAPFLGSVDYFSSPTGPQGVISAVAIIFFAFLGFEDLVKISDETKDPRKTIPKALILSLVISTVLYMLLAITVVSVVPTNQLASSTSPLTDVALAAQGPSAAALLSIIAIIATSNTVLVIAVATSRIMYGMSRASSLPSVLSRTTRKKRTPWSALVAVTIASFLFILIGDVQTVAIVTNFTIFLVFLSVNLSLIMIERRTRRANKNWFSRWGRSSLVASLGAISSVLLLTQFDPRTMVLGALAIAAGTILYFPIHR